MSTSSSLEALRRANPRRTPRFPHAVEAAADAVRSQIDSAPLTVAAGARPRRLVRVWAAGATLAAAAVATAVLTVGSTGRGPGVESATAAVRRAAAATAASAERSGTAVVRIDHNGELWAGSTIRWHDGDLAVTRDAPRRPGKVGTELLVVGGTMYGIDPAVDGGWVVLGPPESIDAGSGTTPGEYLAAVRKDIGGVTLRRLTDGVGELTTVRLDDGSTVYRGTLPAGLIARESGFKEGRPIRVFPFGYVAHDEAADPAAPLAVAVTVGADGLVRQITVTWGTSASAWSYTVSYESLGATAAPVAPEDAKPLRAGRR